MTVRESVAFNLGRDSEHAEYGWPSQRERAEALFARLACAAVGRFLVRAYAREGGTQG
jgi:hypothetical protein